MDHDADVVPPFEWRLVRKIAFVGLSFIAVAAVLGLVATALTSPPWAIHTARLFLVVIGAITVGAAVSMRADLWQTWAMGAFGALLAMGGTPAHWDSFRLLFGVMATVAITFALVKLALPYYRLLVLSAILLFHFCGIFFATTSPPSTPWITEQAFVRVYNPYLQFIYMRNAYHFYSPEPGPASVLVFMLKTETGTDPKTGQMQYQTRWIAMPKRPGDVKDPLGLTYYRRLSITEQLARASPGFLLPSNFAEKREMEPRRRRVPIPLHPGEEILRQYRLPHSDVARFVIPSYASHVILENTDKVAAGKTTVKIYRLEHPTLSVEDFANPRNRPDTATNPFSPTTYRPYFLGEFDAFGKLLNPQEPMLYWLVPIYPRQVPPGDTTKRNFIDYMSIHGLDMLNLSVDEVDDPKYKDRVFDWNQLR